MAAGHDRPAAVADQAELPAAHEDYVARLEERQRDLGFTGVEGTHKVTVTRGRVYPSGDADTAMADLLEDRVQDVSDTYKVTVTRGPQHAPVLGHSASGVVTVDRRASAGDPPIVHDPMTPEARQAVAERPPIVHSDRPAAPGEPQVTRVLPTPSMVPVPESGEVLFGDRTIGGAQPAGGAPVLAISTAGERSQAEIEEAQEAARARAEAQQREAAELARRQPERTDDAGVDGYGRTVLDEKARDARLQREAEAEAEAEAARPASTGRRRRRGQATPAKATAKPAVRRQAAPKARPAPERTSEAVAPPMVAPEGTEAADERAGAEDEV